MTRQTIPPRTDTSRNPNVEPAQRLTYFIDRPDAKRKERPEIWTTTNNYNGEMFRSYPSFSHIPGTKAGEPTRYGPLIFDIDTGPSACNDARSTIVYFENVYGLEPEQWSIYLSGKKGVHLELPAGVMGMEEGHPLLPLIYKRLVLDVQAALDLEYDLSMYNMGTGKPYRMPNVKRPDTGTYKRQVDLDELICCIDDQEEYTALVSEPGRVINTSKPIRNGPLATKITEYGLEAEKAWKELQNQPEMSEEAKERLREDTPSCVRYMQNTSNGKATFNEVAMALTGYFVSTSISEADFLGSCKGFIENYPSTSLTTHDKRYQNCRNRYRTMTAYGYSFGCGYVLALKFPGSAFECKGCPYRVEENLSTGTDYPDPTALLEVFEVKKDYIDKLGQERFLYDNYLIAQHVITVIAMSGAGKTTFNYFHVAPKLAQKGLTVWYIDADSPASDHKKMKEVADRYGFKFLNPDVNEGTSVETLMETFYTIAEAHADLTDNVFFFDTLKKVADLMSKGSVKDFFKLVRKLANLGATVVLLGHANKYRDKEGNLVFEGVGDVRSDSDELIQLEAVKNNFDGINVTTVVDPDKGAKVRGLFKPFSFNISSSRAITLYDTPLTPVDHSASKAVKATDEEILEAAVHYLEEIGKPIIQKQLVEHTADITASSAKRVRQLIVQHAEMKSPGQMPEKRFLYTMGKRNSHMYELPPKKPVVQTLLEYSKTAT